MEKERIEVAIIGRWNTGKTTIGKIILDALKAEGIDVEFTSHDNLPDFFMPDFQEKRVKVVREKVKVDIQEKNGWRETRSI